MCHDETKWLLQTDYPFIQVHLHGILLKGTPQMVAAGDRRHLTRMHSERPKLYTVEL